MSQPKEPSIDDRADAFETLGIPACFDIDPAAVQSAWLRNAAAAHPDRAGASTDTVRRAALLNDARDALLDPMRRAELLLARRTGTDTDASKELPDGFLTEIFSIREELADARSSGDEGDTAVRELERWARERRTEYLAQLTAAFAATPIPTRDIRRTLNAWRYIERMLEE